MKTLSFLFVLLIFFSPPLLAQWERTGGPYGGFVLSEAANDQYLFASTSNGVFRSADEGQNWQRMENGLPLSFICYDIKAHEENLIFLGSDYLEDFSTGYDVYTSHTNGDEWVEITLPDTTLFPDEVAIYEEQIFIADKAILKSENGGQTWTNILSASDTFSYASTLEVYEGELYVLSNQKLWTTSNWGSNWNVVTLPPGINAYNVYPKDSSLILIGHRNAFHSTDFGENWELASGWESANSRRKDILLLNDTFYVNSTFLLQSSDNGLSWEVAPSTSGFYVQGITAFNGALFACSFSEGIRRYDRQEENYTIRDFGIDATSINSFATHGDDLWAGVYYNGLYRYDMEEEKWDTTNYFPVPLELPDIAWLSDSLFVLHYYQGVYRSGDGGQSWTDVSPDNFSSYKKLAVHGQTLFLYNDYLHLSYQSNNFGDTWESALPTFRAQTSNRPTGFAAHGTNLFATTWDAVYRSVDNGVSWEKKSNGITTNPINNILSAGDLLFVESYNYDTLTGWSYFLLYTSSDNGENWEQTMDGLPSIELYLFGEDSPAEIVSFQDTFVLALPYDGIYFMTRDSLEWQPLMVGGRFPRGASALTLSHNKLFAGTSGMGVWQMNATKLPTGIKQATKNFSSLNISPNPAHTTISLSTEIAPSGKGYLFIYNLQGELVYFEKTVMDASTTISVSHLPAGAYFVKLELKGNLHLGKFIKQ